MKILNSKILTALLLLTIVAFMTGCKKYTEPLLTTTLFSISSTTVISGGNVTSDGGETVTARGVCWNTSANPTVANSKTTDGTGIGAFTSSITELTRNTTYYIRAYATNSVGTSYGNEISFKTATAFIGDSYQGGKVAYILRTGELGYVEGETHGLIVTPYDLQTYDYQSRALLPYAQWDNEVTTITTGATGKAIGTGNANTIAIVSKLGEGRYATRLSVYAAKLCYDLVLDGYSDWYLPSRDELTTIYINKAVIGGFSGSPYWSSTESSSNNVWIRDFHTGWSFDINKGSTLRVRAVRSF